jgi:hypothetical protein
MARVFHDFAEWTDTRVRRRGGLVAIAMRVQQRREAEVLQLWRDNTDSRIALRNCLQMFVRQRRQRAATRVFRAWQRIAGERARGRRLKLEAREEYITTIAFRAWRAQWQRRRQLMQKVGMLVTCDMCCVTL